MRSLYEGREYEFELTTGPRLVAVVERVRAGTGEVTVRCGPGSGGLNVGKVWILNPRHIVAASPR